MKKIITIMIGLLMVISLIGCTNGAPAQESAGQSASVAPSEAPASGEPAAPTEAASEAPAPADNPIAGAAVDENGEPYVLGYVTNETSSGWNSFGLAYLKGIWEAAGGEFISYVSDYDLDKEVSMFNDLKQMKPNAILVHPSDSYAIAPTVKTAMDEGYPVFAVDMGVIGADVTSYISVDQVEMGRQCAKYVMAQFSEQNPGVILEIAGGLEQDGAQKRQKGFHEIMDQCSYCEIVQVIDTGWSSDVAFDGIQDAFELNDNINCIYSHSDFMMQGVIEGLRVKDKLVPAGQDGHIIIASIDGDSTGLKAIRDGYVDMIAENSPLMHMAVTVNAILSKLYGTDPEAEYSLPVNVITSENASDETLWGNLEVGASPYVEQDVCALPTR